LLGVPPSLTNSKKV
jgi:hypothetical protein